MAADITLWQTLQETKTQKSDPPKDYISALWSEYKRERSDKVLGRFVQYDNNALPQESVASSRHGSVDSTINSEAMVKATAAVQASPDGDRQRETSWWRRPVDGKDMESFVHMAFSVS